MAERARATARLIPSYDNCVADVQFILHDKKTAFQAPLHPSPDVKSTKHDITPQPNSVLVVTSLDDAGRLRYPSVIRRLRVATL